MPRLKHKLQQYREHLARVAMIFDHTKWLEEGAYTEAVEAITELVQHLGERIEEAIDAGEAT